MAKSYTDCSPLADSKCVSMCVRMRLFTLFELILVCSLVCLIAYVRIPLPCADEHRPSDQVAEAGPSQPEPLAKQTASETGESSDVISGDPEQQPLDDPSHHLRRFVSADFHRPLLAPWGRSSTGQRGEAPPSGLCIAIPSAPRFDPDGEEPSWQRVEDLLLALDERRARSGEGLLERSMRVVVYSSGCRVDSAEPAAGGKNRGRASPGGATPAELMRMAAAFAREANVSEHYAQPLLGSLSAEARSINPLVDAHTAAIRAVADRMELPVDVLSAHPDGCALMGDAGRLLRSAPRQHVERDGWQRWRWHAKLSMDFAYAVRQCLATRPRYVLLLQDDAFPARLWDVGIERFLARDLRGKPDWDVLSLYSPRTYRWNLKHAQEYSLPCCAQALLFAPRSAEEAVAHVERGMMRAPMDLLLHEFMEEEGEGGRKRRRGYVHVPSLFQHTGRVRSTGQGREKGSFHEDVQFPDERVDAPYLAEEKLALLRGKPLGGRADGPGGAFGQVEPDGWHEFLEAQRQELARQTAGAGAGGVAEEVEREEERPEGGSTSTSDERNLGGERREQEGAGSAGGPLRPQLRAELLGGDLIRQHFMMKDMMVEMGGAEKMADGGRAQRK